MTDRVPLQSTGTSDRRARPTTMIVVIEDQDSFDKALAEAGSKLVVVDFTATWCGPCQSIAPFFKSLSQDHEDVVFLKVDVDDAQDVAQSCEIKCMPTFHFYKEGKKVDEFSGSNQAKLEDMIKTLK
ncbi:thioredoxin-like [Denticeps clupeoides]|uniref:Thioredoxin a n=1 Tax=Denticeps clupeoides TaxID=299321 RepID=A0AAY4ERC9_9TELE|nr:thioredoxin-like [Denticeps clupeoides]